MAAMAAKQEGAEKEGEDYLQEGPESACGVPVAAPSRFSITRADLPLVLLSSICFVSYVAMGYFVGAIGAAIPELADHLGRENTSLSVVYTARGIGFFLGTFLGSAQNEVAWFRSVRTDVRVCLPTLLVGCGSFVLYSSPLRLDLILGIVCLQASMFSYLDVVGNTLLMEIWGNRVEPWLQALHAFFGIGAVAGPAIVGVLKFRTSSLCLCIICLIPSAIAVISHVWSFDKKKMDHVAVDIEEDNLKEESAVTDVDSPHENNNACDTKRAITWKLQLLFFLFYFIYVGLETGFGGWISAFSLDTNSVSSDSRAAFLSSIFFFGITVGRLLSVPIAMYVSPTRMMCCLLFIVVSGVILFTIMTLSDNAAKFSTLVASSAILGLGISSIYPVGLTISQDYNVTMDPRSISICCIGAVCGEAVVPMCFGLLMHAYSPYFLTHCTIIVTICVTLLYFFIHLMLSSISQKTMTVAVVDASRLADEESKVELELPVGNPLRREVP